jgi:hypothetical protein
VWGGQGLPLSRAIWRDFSVGWRERVCIFQKSKKWFGRERACSLLDFSKKWLGQVYPYTVYASAYSHRGPV